MRLRLFGVLVLTLIIFAPGVTPSASGDDYVHLFKNREAPSRWLGYFLQVDGREYRPLVRVSLALDHQIWGDRLWGYHLTNLILHLAVVLSLFWLAGSLTDDPRVALVTCGLFATHPIHSYCVNALMGRTDLLFTLFYVLALSAALRRRDAVACVCFVLSLLSKESAVTLPLMAWIALRLGRRFTTEGRSGRLAVLLFAGDFVYLLLRLTWLKVESDDLAVYISAGPAKILLNLIFYAGGLLFPFAGYTLRHWIETRPWTVLFPASLIGLGVALWLWKVRTSLAKPFWMGLAWIPITLIPVVFLFQRRFLYGASVGFCLALAWILTRTLRRSGFIPTTLLVAVFALVSLTGTREWRTAAARSAQVLDSLAAQVGRDTEAQWFVANVPHGLGEAHLFTHDSIRYALARRLGLLPHVQVLTRIQLAPAREISPTVVQSAQTLVTRIRPGPQQYFVFDAPELLPKGGRQLPAGTRFQKGPFEIEVTDNTAIGEVSEVTIRWETLTTDQRLIALQPW